MYVNKLGGQVGTGAGVFPLIIDLGIDQLRGTVSAVVTYWYSSGFLIGNR